MSASPCGCDPEAGWRCENCRRKIATVLNTLVERMDKCIEEEIFQPESIQPEQEWQTMRDNELTHEPEKAEVTDLRTASMQEIQNAENRFSKAVRNDWYRTHEERLEEKYAPISALAEPQPKRTGHSLAEVRKFRSAMYTTSMALVEQKGADYNRDQQTSGDTLFNLRVCELLGVVPSAEEGILVRLTDKLMRLISLTKPGRDAVVKDESVLDTIRDIHNYVDYLGLMWMTRREQERSSR